MKVDIVNLNLNAVATLFLLTKIVCAPMTSPRAALATIYNKNWGADI